MARLVGHVALLASAAGFLLLSSLAEAAGPPQVAALWVADVTSTSASLHGEVDPEGLPTGYRFEYLTEANYLAGGESFNGAGRAPAFGESELGAAETVQPALDRISGLLPGTVYRYRIVATNTASSELAHTFTTQPAESGIAAECANAQLRFEDNSFGLPDCRAWELVSPVDKNGGAIQGFGQIFGGGVLQVAADGEAAGFSSASSFAGGQGAPTASQYISRRNEGGWSTENITAPTVSGAYGNANSGVPYQLFSGDLARGLLLDGRRCGEAEPCLRSYSLRESGAGALTTSPAEPDLRFVGAGADLGQVILSTCAALTSDATEVPGGGGGCDPSDPNLYRWSGGVLTLLNLLPGEAHGTPGAHLAAQGGAVSTDGSRVYFTGGEDGALYLREAGQTKLVPETSGGGEAFQTASADGQVAFFIKGSHLYRYSAATQAATDLTASGGVLGVLGASTDGLRVYYATVAGLFLWQAPGATVEVAPSVKGIPAADAGDFPPTTGTARVSADGTHLAFLSKASLSGYDNTDQQTGEPDSEVYLYTAGSGEGTLTCASCNPTGERPLGPSTIPGATANGNLAEDPTATDAYKPRDLSSDGARLFFDSSDRIVPEDAGAATDVYEWEAQGEGSCQLAGACVSLISSGHNAEASSFVDASADGRDAFFLTGDSLLPGDPGSVDLYDARAGGGLPEPEKPIECDGDACQSLPSPPQDPSPGTLVPGPANPEPHFVKAHHKKPKRHHHRKHKKHHERTHKRGRSR